MIEGYLPDTLYLATFIRELAPAWLDRVALARGVAPPRSSPDQPFRYCELGCGRGVTTNILAAASPNGVFLGLDALWAADIIRPVDPEIPGLPLDGINPALRRMAEEGDIPGLFAIPHGTALPAAAS